MAVSWKLRSTKRALLIWMYTYRFMKDNIRPLMAKFRKPTFLAEFAALEFFHLYFLIIIINDVETSQNRMTS